MNMFVTVLERHREQWNQLWNRRTRSDESNHSSIRWIEIPHASIALNDNNHQEISDRTDEEHNHVEDNTNPFVVGWNDVSKNQIQDHLVR